MQLELVTWAVLSSGQKSVPDKLCCRTSQFGAILPACLAEYRHIFWKGSFRFACTLSASKGDPFPGEIRCTCRPFRLPVPQ